MDDAEVPQGVKDSDAEELYKAGLFLLKREKVREALVAFKRALSIKDTEARYMSYTGYCLAVSEGKTKEAVMLCEKAAEKEFYRPELLLNLGRVYLLAGNRRKAHMAFRKGMTLDRENNELKSDLELMGVRKSPVIPFLDRKHPINKLAGKVLYRLHLR
jgi:Flp pilus assembly protein TadD